jgi:hypothetical protein
MTVGLGQLETATRPRGKERGDETTQLNAGIAMLQAIEPKDELEAALALQIVGAHSFAMEMWGRARGTDRNDHIELYGNMAVKASRAMAMMTEALAKLRTGGKQRVEVTYVDARNSQNIIGGGGGGSTPDREQSQVPEPRALAFDPGEPCPPVRSEDASWSTLPRTRGQGAEKVSQARRDQPRRASRATERELPDGAAHEGDA